MNLSKLFEIQEKLDERIVQEHNLQGQDLLDKKILALQVELGELANEWRRFKFWSKDQEPRIKVLSHRCPYCDKGKIDYGYTVETCDWCDGDYKLGYKNPLLEEYVDNLHFILSVGLELEMDKKKLYIGFSLINDHPLYIFNQLFADAAALGFSALHGTKKYLKYESFFNTFISLGKQLGFTWEQIEQAYLDKNKINHERQENGY